MLQIAHEAVAQGVEDHSDFKGNPFKRLLGTLEATYAVVYGTEELARGVGRRIQWIHDFVTGPGYRANDPANLLWVHATLVDTALRCHLELVGALSEEDQEAYYQEMKLVALAFGLPVEDQPPTLADFRVYFEETVTSLDVTPVGKDLATFILDPTLPLGLHVPFKPLLALQRFYTLGFLPPPIREQLGQPWTELDARRYERLQLMIRTMFFIVPRPLRTLAPRLNGNYLLWLARRHVRQFDKRMQARGGGAVAAA